MKNNSSYKCKFLKTKAYCIIKNSNDIQKDITSLNSGHKAKTIYSYDFSKLYTNIPHDLLIENMKFVIEEAFKIKEDSEFIKINKKSANWCKKKPKQTKMMYANKDELLAMLEYLLNNVYVKYRNKLFRQIIGIPMGTDCAPELANLFLFAFEYKYVMGLIDIKSNDIKLLRFIYRYVDDLIVFNDNGYFDQMISSIYPKELELNATATSVHHTTYLDMDISIVNRQFVHKLYDKRNDFSFEVISLPNLSGNIPIEPTYSVFYSQIVRYFHANNERINFVESVKKLIDKLCHQNFNYNKLLSYLKKFLTKFELQIVSKFSTLMNVSNFK